MYIGLQTSRFYLIFLIFYRDRSKSEGSMYD